MAPASAPAMPRLLVLYGSETGTAQDVAEFVQQRAFNRQLLDTQISAMDEFPAAQLLPQCSTVVFVVSTTGDGEAPENMRNSWRSLLRKTLGSQWLEGVRVAVFGLGDSSYAKYNAVARRLQARLLQLGASELIDRGLGDDQHAYGYFGALNPWMEKLWTAVLQLHPLPDGVTIDDSPKPIDPRYSVIVHGAGAKEVQEAKLLTPRTDDSRFYAPPHTTVGREKGIYLAPVVVNKRITAEDWEQDVRHLEFDVSEDSNATEPPFRAGDIAVVYPENVTGVDDMLKYVKLDGDTVISINTADGSKQFDLPSPTTVRDLFTKHLAILEIPRRSFFERLSLFAVNEEEKEKLEELASAEGVDLLYDYCIREKKTYAEVLTDFPSVDVPLTILLQLIPRQKPRSYSISSSALLHPGRSLGPSNEQKRVPMWIKKGLFEPPSLDRNVLLIGPGTGLASMRAMVQERQFLRKQANETVQGRLTSTSDAVMKARTSFMDHKIYVQTRLAENKEAIFDFIITARVAFTSLGLPSKCLPMSTRCCATSFDHTNLSGMDVLEQAQHVRTFVKLANLTQTSQLHEWNLESLQRALEWACAAEDAVGGGESQQDVEMRIRRWFPVATLPTLPLDKALTADALRLARIHLLRSILQSPFLASHPTRSEMLVAVLQELQSRREDSSSDEVEEHSPNR
ncbi:Flavoprotein-like domain [Phytophthora cactorum]|nr:Flavoprotein-like domain [Phytophthora cactorum]